jgi:hypothetical protein
MLEIYSSDIDGKMNLVFKVFDFDGDGKITAEDVRMILSYIPRSREQCTSSLETTFEESKTTCNVNRTSDKKEKKPSLGGKKRRKGEGLYFSSMGKNDDEDDRKKDTEKIIKFIEYVFKDKKSINLADFTRFNTESSSEMLLSVMSVLHERIPCSEFYYREKRNFKQHAV